MFKFEILMPGVSIGGHPFQLLFNDSLVLDKKIDELRAAHPGEELIVKEWRPQEIYHYVPPKPPKPTKCPEGHEKIIDGKSCIQYYRDGYYCSICGSVFSA